MTDRAQIYAAARDFGRLGSCKVSDAAEVGDFITLLNRDCHSADWLLNPGDAHAENQVKEILVGMVYKAMLCMERHGVMFRVVTRREKYWTWLGPRTRTTTHVYASSSTHDATLTEQHCEAAVNGERDYQDSLPTDRREPKELPHSLGSYLTMFRRYLAHADAAWTDNAGDGAALEVVRKLAGIAVHALEDHGLPTERES